MKASKHIPVILLLIFKTGFHVHAAEEDFLGIEVMMTGLGANDLTDMAWDGEYFWVEGSGTLSMLSGEGFQASDWVSYSDIEGFGEGSVTAMWASGDTLVVSWGYNDMYREELWPFGDGISVSVDHGATWRHVDVVEMFPDREDWTDDPGLTTTIYDIEYENGMLWCCTTAGYLLKSPDLGETWTQIIPYVPDDLYGDGIPARQYCGDPDSGFDYANYNHHGQCVDVYGDTLWVGTFRGINLSTDGGETWKNFHWPLVGEADPDTLNVPGNFVVAVEHTVVNGKTYVWVASQDYLGYGRIGIFHTDDNGATWHYDKELDNRTRPYNITFGADDPEYPEVSAASVFVATTGGLLVSHDLGGTWETLEIRESDSMYWESESGVASVMTVGNDLWATSSDGIARSRDWGATWDIFKGITRVKTIDTGNPNVGISPEPDLWVKTYAFPNPFSPSRGSADYSRTRIQYALEESAVVTIKIYNYSGHVIRDIVDGESRDGGRDYQEAWNGRDADGEIVPNGVYFYTITTNRGDSARGKIMVLD